MTEPTTPPTEPVWRRFTQRDGRHKWIAVVGPLRLIIVQRYAEAAIYDAIVQFLPMPVEFDELGPCPAPALELAYAENRRPRPPAQLRDVMRITAGAARRVLADLRRRCRALENAEEVE